MDSDIIVVSFVETEQGLLGRHTSDFGPWVIPDREVHHAILSKDIIPNTPYQVKILKTTYTRKLRIGKIIGESNALAMVQKRGETRERLKKEKEKQLQRFIQHLKKIGVSQKETEIDFEGNIYTVTTFFSEYTKWKVKGTSTFISYGTVHVNGPNLRFFKIEEIPYRGHLMASLASRG
ncbi:MAG: hypothetical protein Q8P20_02560 [bacterium]|nr:hypothetical protein [bacterium]